MATFYIVSLLHVSGELSNGIATPPLALNLVKEDFYDHNFSLEAPLKFPQINLEIQPTISLKLQKPNIVLIIVSV